MVAEDPLRPKNDPSQPSSSPPLFPDLPCIHITSEEFAEWKRNQLGHVLCFDGASKGNPRVADVGGVILFQESISRQFSLGAWDMQPTTRRKPMPCFKVCCWHDNLVLILLLSCVTQRQFLIIFVRTVFQRI
jgi:hypothetical protein